MPIDTRNKRFSIMGMDMSFLRVFPNPDGSFNSSDRQHFLWKYVGIAFDLIAGPSLDTRNKRFSIMGMDLPFLRVFPNPDGSFNSSDRQHFLWKYSGVAFGGVVGAAMNPFLIYRRRAR